MFSELFNALTANGKTCCLSVTTITFEVLLKAAQCRDDVKALLATRRAAAELRLFVIAQNQYRFVDLFCQLPRNQTNNALVPVVSIYQDHWSARLLLCLGTDIAHQFFGLLLAFDVKLLQLSGQGRGLLHAIGGQELEGYACFLHAPGGVNARCEPKCDVAFA